MISTAVPQSARSRALGIKVEFSNFQRGQVAFTPQSVAVVGQGRDDCVYSDQSRTITTAAEAGRVYGFGSPIHLAVLELLPENGQGVASIPVTVYPLDKNISGTKSTATICIFNSATDSHSINIRIGGVSSSQIGIPTGTNSTEAAVFISNAINATPSIPVTATASGNDVVITSKWSGTSANGIKFEILGDAAFTSGLTYAIESTSGGSGNPDIAPALNFGSTWHTLVVNLLGTLDTVALEKIEQYGISRWESLTSKPFVSFTGRNESDLNIATAIPDNRSADYINAQISAPDSPSLDFVIAAAAVAKIAMIADSNPPQGYGGRSLPTLTPGAPGGQWNYAARDIAIKRGVGNTIVQDSEIYLNDVVTFYHPEGEINPAFRYVVNIIKLQSLIYTLNRLGRQQMWQSVPLLPDDQATRNTAARSPKSIKAAIFQVIDRWALDALISDPEFSKENAIVEINTQNPNRLDICIPVKLSGNIEILSIDLKFGFYFGGES